MIFQIGLPVEMIRVTAQYSNAVLTAVLPYVSNAVHKLDLPLPYPPKVENVVECNIMPQRRVGDLSAEVAIRGGWAFAFQHGHIDTIQGPREVFTIQDFEKIPQYYGEVRMSEAEAVQFARDTLKKLGVRLESVFAEQQPEVWGPIKVGTNTVPHYRIQWFSPLSVGQAPPSVDMDIDASTKQLARLHFSPNKNLERTPPKIATTPESSRLFPSPNPAYTKKLVPIVFLSIDNYGEKLSLPIPRPLTTNYVAKFFLEDNGGWPHCEIELTNGWRFIYRNSMVNGYYAPDNFFNSGNRPITIEEFTGKWNMTESQAIELIKKTIAKLNYPTNRVHLDFNPQIRSPRQEFQKMIPRRFFEWDYIAHDTDDDLQSRIEAEVDFDKRELKSLYYDDKAYWNHPPPIDVPISLDDAQRSNGESKLHSPGDATIGRE